MLHTTRKLYPLICPNTPISITLEYINDLPRLRITLESGSITINPDTTDVMLHTLDGLLEYFHTYLEVPCWLFDSNITEHLDSKTISDGINCTIAVSVRRLDADNVTIAMGSRHESTKMSLQTNRELATFINTLITVLVRIRDVIST